VKAGAQPVEVGLAGGVNLENQELGGLVAVQFMQPGLQAASCSGPVLMSSRVSVEDSTTPFQR
jgi:hypothetical protein